MGARPRNRVQKLALGSVPDRAPGRGVASRGACAQTRDATNSTTPPQTRRNPRVHECDETFHLGKDLVRKSAAISSVGQ
jgi:hypothetical protein